MKKFFQIYLVPGFIFQSLTIGGGYGTGRELVEFFLMRGPMDGLRGMAVAALIWSLVLALTFELARITQAFNYRAFIRTLLGRAWWGYEVVYGLGMIVVVSVVGSASGEILQEMSGASPLVGIILMSMGVGVLAFAGSTWIERVLSAWSIALYAFYLVLVVLFLTNFHTEIGLALGREQGDGLWLLGGIKYAAYNVGIAPAILYVARHFSNRKEALISGTIAGLITMIPGVFIYLAMLSQYPHILEEVIPANFLMGQLNISWIQGVFQVILFGTLVETGVGLIHGFNERIDGVFQEQGRGLKSRTRLLIAVGVLLLSIFLADSIGLVQLIAQGYSALTWGYWLVFVIPVLFWGGYQIFWQKNTGNSGP